MSECRGVSHICRTDCTPSRATATESTRAKSLRGPGGAARVLSVPPSSAAVWALSRSARFGSLTVHTFRGRCCVEERQRAPGELAIVQPVKVRQGGEGQPIRRAIFTTCAIESLNSTVRRAVRTRGHFPNDRAATKLICLALRGVQ